MTDSIVVEGITHKGKKCVSKKGQLWEIHAKTEKVLFNPENGPWLYISPYGTTHLSKDAMWVKELHDVDFKIVNLVQH